MEQQTSKQTQEKKKSSYNWLSHSIDKAILNFGMGFVIASSIAILVVMKINRMHLHGWIPFILFLLIAVGFAYAFGGIGISASKTKAEGYRVTKTAAVAASTVSSFVYWFPVFFLQIILSFMIYILPVYSVTIRPFLPRVTKIYGYFRSTCEASGKFCAFNSQFGAIMGGFLDLLILLCGLGILFSVINSIVAIIKLSGNSNTA